MTDIDGQEVAGRWLSIQEAARHLSVSERTVFRRVERGQLRRRIHQDGHSEVWMPLADDGQVSSQTSDTDGQERALLLVDRFGQAVSRQLEPLLGELSASRETIVALAQENGRLQARVAELERELTTDRQVADTGGQGWWARFRLWLSPA